MIGCATVCDTCGDGGYGWEKGNVSSLEVKGRTSGAALPCNPPPGGPVPPPVPSSGNKQSLAVVDEVHNSSISGLLITCANTGVTLTSQCSAVDFFRPFTGGPFTYSTPGGAGTRCTVPLDSHNYSSGSVTSSAGQEHVPVTQL